MICRSNNTVMILFLCLFGIFAFGSTAQAQREIDTFDTLIREAITNAASLKKCTDEVNQVVNSLSTDSSFAGSVFKAATTGNNSGLQTLFSQRTPSCSVQVAHLEQDFNFSIVFGNPQTGNHFFLCFASRNHPKKCEDGTRFDISIVAK